MFRARDRPSWASEGVDWPNREASRFVRAANLDWHVQMMGEGPDVLLLHGTGASTHSWRDVAPLLARTHRVIAPDLPGHGFTAMPGSSGLSLRGMAAAVAGLLDVLGAKPVAGIGHSAGGAVLATMAIEGGARPSAIVAINGALMPIRHAGLFAPLARLLFLNPVAPRLFALRGESPSAVRRLIEGTGSHLDARGIELYRRLMRHAGHVEGALGMMANWDLGWLRANLGRLDVPLWLITADGDRAVPPSDAQAVCRLVPTARHLRFAHGGHLAHEEYPEMMVEQLAILLDEATRLEPRLSGLSA